MSPHWTRNLGAFLVIAFSLIALWLEIVTGDLRQTVQGIRSGSEETAQQNRSADSLNDLAKSLDGIVFKIR